VQHLCIRRWLVDVHSYQGWKNVIVICVLGILFGITRRVARELADEHHGPCLGRRLGGLAELRGPEVDRRFGLWLMPTYFQSHGQTGSNPRACLINVIGKVISPASNG